jgi:hypothetical protein
MTQPNVQDVEKTNTQILGDIQNLQSFEQEMFSNLEENPMLTQQQQQAIIQKINQISSMRLNLYKTLNGVNGYFQNSLYNSKGTLEEQATTIDIVEEELNKAKKKLKILEEEKNNKIRLIEINTYYGEKYQEHAELMKIIIFTLIPIIILAVLHNKGLIPKTIFYILIVIIAAIGSYFMWFRLASIWNRDNMNYQEYNWPVYNPSSSATTTTTTSTGDPWATTSTTTTSTAGCVDEYCCATGTTYDASLNQCVIPTSSSSTTTSTTTSTSGSTPAPAYGSGTILDSAQTAYNSGSQSMGSNFSLGGVESFTNLTESFTKHARITQKPSATLNSTYTPKMSDSFIYK